MKISGSHQQQCFTHASPPWYSVQTDDKPVYEKKVKHLPERVKQQCNPFPLCYAHLYTSSAICRCISLLFHHCPKLQNKQKTVKFSLSLDIHYTQSVNSRGRVAVFIQQFLMSNISCWELNSKYLFGVTISIKLTISFFRFFRGYGKVTPQGLKPNTAELCLKNNLTLLLNLICTYLLTQFHLKALKYYSRWPAGI